MSGRGLVREVVRLSHQPSLTEFFTAFGIWSSGNDGGTIVLTNHSKQGTFPKKEKYLAARLRFVSMRFGERIRRLCQARKLNQRSLGASVCIEFDYISKIGNEKLDYWAVPNEHLIQKLVEALNVDEYELFVLWAKMYRPKYKGDSLIGPTPFSYWWYSMTWCCTGWFLR